VISSGLGSGSDLVEGDRSIRRIAPDEAIFAGKERVMFEHTSLEAIVVDVGMRELRAKL
jgi:hypothetical protein